MTRAERIIWQGPRALCPSGTGFRRQTPIGIYFVDFVSHAAKVSIKVDGGQHFGDAHEAREAARDTYLRSQRFRVLRFNNYDVMANRESVLSTIAAVGGEAVGPSLPSRASGGGGEAAACGADTQNQMPGGASP
jgi:very-short-patch-repair endonuclease